MPPPSSLLFFLLSIINCSVLLKINSDTPIYWGHGRASVVDNPPHYFHTKNTKHPSILWLEFQPKIPGRALNVDS